jgi:hypothetical protein
MTVLSVYDKLYAFSKRVRSEDLTSACQGLEGTESPIIILTDGAEDETEQINGMRSEDLTSACTSYTILKGYKSWVGDWIGN